MDKKIKTEWIIEYNYSCPSWVSCYKSHSEIDAQKELLALREKNLHRDGKVRAYTRPCTIWTPDGTWKTYTSAPTKYRLVQVETIILDEDKNE